ncbi:MULTISPECIES: MFS transporter [Halolamina]|uniref:Major Facilitator Superfamily protein n=1 Tax=Halolamina pelagica TaxID=699431 RepID=A0A1I5RK60_9EURY|nr:MULTISPECIES: MFS transporter [Halolamina]NHX35230.1 MFS transporter [Halolamina sp. R1-12]SFP58954.1 Major Facilitator Superfamily protein [Halolamina pelagica]
MVPRLPSRAILRFYAFRVSQSAGFSLPIYVLFFQSRGLSLAEIGAVEALFTVLVLVAETPTGYLGDRFGRRASLLAGTVLSAVGIVGFVFARSFASFAAVIAVRAVAEAFRSGATDAWLYETLAGDAEGDRFAHVSGRASAFGLATLAGASLVGGALYALDPIYPWLLEGAAVAVGLVILLGMDEPDRTVDGGNGADGDPDGGDAVDETRFSPSATFDAVRSTLANRAVGPLMLAVGVLAGITNTMEFYLQPVAVATPWLSATELGPLYAGLTLASAGIAARAGWIEARFGVRGWFLVGPPLLGVMLVVVAVAPALALPAFVLGRAVRSATTPIFGQYLNDRTDESRATVLSAASTVRSLFTAPLNLVGGGLATTYALSTGLGGLGALLLVGLGLTLTAWVPVERTERSAVAQS